MEQYNTLAAVAASSMGFDLVEIEEPALPEWVPTLSIETMVSMLELDRVQLRYLVDSVGDEPTDSEVNAAMMRMAA